MSLFARAKKARENKKGFTLVELIVVLVILAILAAILVPALLGWIDEAKKKQSVLEARNVYMATQTVADEHYARAASSETKLQLEAKDITRIETLADVTNLVFTYVTLEGGSGHDGFTINGMAVQFDSSEEVIAELSGDTWEVYDNTSDFSGPTGTQAKLPTT